MIWTCVLLILCCSMLGLVFEARRIIARLKSYIQEYDRLYNEANEQIRQMQMKGGRVDTRTMNDIDHDRLVEDALNIKDAADITIPMPTFDIAEEIEDIIFSEDGKVIVKWRRDES